MTFTGVIAMIAYIIVAMSTWRHDFQLVEEINTNHPDAARRLDMVDTGARITQSIYLLFYAFIKVDRSLGEELLFRLRVSAFSSALQWVLLFVIVGDLFGYL
jgi:hypothetical protein